MSNTYALFFLWSHPLVYEDFSNFIIKICLELRTISIPSKVNCKMSHTSITNSIVTINLGWLRWTPLKIELIVFQLMFINMSSLLDHYNYILCMMVPTSSFFASRWNPPNMGSYSFSSRVSMLAFKLSNIHSLSLQTIEDDKLNRLVSMNSSTPYNQTVRTSGSHSVTLSNPLRDQLKVFTVCYEECYRQWLTNGKWYYTNLETTCMNSVELR